MVGRWLGYEARLLIGSLRSPWPWLLVATMLIGGMLVYRAPFRVALDIGGSPGRDCFTTGQFDRPYIGGFNTGGANDGAEFELAGDRCANAKIAYRWAFEDARIVFPAVGRAPFAVTLQTARGRPDDQPVASAMEINNAPLLALPLRPDPRSYHVLTPPAGSDFDLRFQTPTVPLSGDERSLAFAADRVALASLAAPAPDWAELGVLGLVVGLAFVLLRRWSLPTLRAALVGALLVGALLLVFLWLRLGLTSYTSAILALLVVAYALTMLLEPLLAALARRCGVIAARGEIRVVVALVVLAWLIRVLGLFHPLAFSSDTGLHVNNLLDVTKGEVIFTEGLPEQAGGGDAPYPPAQYIMLLPLQLLRLPPETLVIAANALADSLAIAWLWLLARVAGGSRTAAIASGVFYLFATPLLRSLLTGEMANVWAQALVLPWIIAVVLWRQERVGSIGLGLITAVVLLSHSGVLLSALAFAAALALLWLPKRDPLVWRWSLIVGVAVIVVGIGFYSAFTDILLNRPNAPPPATSLLQRLLREPSDLLQWDGAIGPLLALLGLSGLLIAIRRRHPLADLLLAWWIGALLSWATLLISEQALRWEAFLFPAIAIGSGLVIASLWQRFGAWRWIAAATMSSAIALGGALWLHRLITYR